MPQPPRPRGALSRASLMVAAALLGVAVSSTPKAKAATFNWNQTAASTYSWTTSANWNVSPYPNAIGDVANLSSGIEAQTVNLDAVITIGELNFGAQGTGSTAGYTLAGGTGGYLVLDDTDGTVSINKLSGSPFLDTITAGIQFNDNLTISNNSGGGTLTISTGVLRSLSSNITLAGASTAGSLGSIIISSVIATAGDLIKNDGGTVQLSGANSYAGTTTVNGGTLFINGTAALPVRSAVTIANGAILDVQQTLTIGSLAGGTTSRLINSSGTSSKDVTIGRDDTSTTFSGQVNPTTTARVGITKIGAGTLTFAPIAASTFTRASVISGGSWKLDFSAGSLTSMLASTLPLTISGGNLEVKGKATSVVNQTLASLTIGTTGGSIIMDPNGSTSGTALTITAAITFPVTSNGGFILVNAPANTSVKLANLITNALPNARLVFSSDTGGLSSVTNVGWATNSGNASNALGNTATYTASLGGTTISTATDTNNSLIDSTTASQTTTVGGAWTTNSLKINSGVGGTGQTLSLGANNLTLTNGGLLFTGANDYTISSTTGVLNSGLIPVAGSSELIIYNYGANNLTIGAIIGTGAGIQTLTKAGTGRLTLTGANTFTGAVFVNGGVLSFSNVAAAGAGSLGNGSATAVTIRDGATLKYTGATGTIAATGAGGHTFALQGGNATIEVTTGASILTLSGVISGAGGLTKSGAGTLNIGVAATYTGPTFVTAGTLQAGIITAAFGATSPLDISAGATLDINSLDQTIGSLSGAGTVTNSTSTAKTLTTGGANISTTFTGSFTNGTATTGSAFTKTGSGVTIIALSSATTWTGNSNVTGGILRLGNNNGLPSTGTWTIANAAGQSQIDLNGYNWTSGAITFLGTGSTTSSEGSVNIGTGTLTLGGNVTYNGIGASSITTLLPAYITATGAGSIALSAARTFTIADSSSVSASAAELTVAAPITGSFGIVKSGFGNLLLSGANTFATATTTLTAGGLILDYTIQNNNKIPGANSLTLNGGGNLFLLGNASANTSQTVLSTTLASGSFNTVTLTPGGAQKVVLSMGAFTRAASAGTIRFNLPTGTQDATNGIITTTTNVNGVLGIGAAWATATDSSGVTNFAVNNGTNNIGLLTSSTKNDVTTWAAGDHVTDSTGYTGTTTTAANINTLRFNSASASTVTLGTNLPLSVLTGGILQTANAANASILGGRLTSGTNELIFTTEVATLPLTVSSAITGNDTISKTGLGTLKLSGTNSYTGQTYVQGGTLQVFGGNAIGDSSSVLLTNTRSSVLELLSSETIGTLATGGNNALSGATEIRLGVNTLTINQSVAGTYSGAVSGSGTLLKSGSATLTYTTNTTSVVSGNTFTGTLRIDQGQITMSGAFSPLPNVTAIILNGPTSGLLIANDQSTASNSKINDAATVTLNNTAGGIGFSITRTAGSTGSETVGALTLGAGHNVIRSTAGTSATVETLTFSSLAANPNHSTVLVRGVALGDSVTPTAIRGMLVITGLTGAVGGGGASGTTNTSIYPYMVGDTTDTGLGSSFVRDIGSGSLKPLTTAEYTTDAAGYNALTAATPSTNNVRFTTGSTLTGTATAINSLVLDGASAITLTGPASVLQITSGAILSTQAVSNTINTFTGITTAGISRDYTIFVTDPSGTLTIASPLTTAAPLVKSGAGALVLSSASNAFTDVYLNQGSVQVDALNKLGSGALKFFGGTLKFGAAFDPTSKTILISTGGATFDTNGFSPTFANAIGNSGAGGVTKNGNGTLTLSGANTFTGASTINAGRLQLDGGANRLAAAAGVTLTGTASLQLGGTTAADQTVTELVGVAGNSIVGGNATVSTLTVNQGTYTSYLGFIGGAGTNENSIALVKQGPGSLTLGAVASTFTGGLTIQAGTVSAGNSDNTFGANGNVITLGHSSGSADATLYVSPTNSRTFAQSIIVASGSTGALTIVDDYGATGVVTFSGAVTVNNNVILSKPGVSTGNMNFTGGFSTGSGTGKDITIKNNGSPASGGLILISTAAVNNAGAIINNGFGTAGVTISADIGSNVTNLTQNSPTSALILSGANIAFTGALSVQAGSLTISGGATTAPTPTSLAVTNGASLSLANSAAQHFSAISGSITLGGTGTTILALELGSTSAYDRLTTSGAGTASGNVQFNLIGNSGFGTGPYNLITSGSGSLNGATYSIGTAPGGYMYSFSSSTSTQIQLALTTAASSDLYWRGGVNASWSAFSGATTNWDLTSSSTSNAGFNPGAANTVTFSNSNAAFTSGTTIATTLDNAYAVNSLNFTGAATGVTIVTIASGVGGTASNLTIAPSSSSNGISVGANAGAVTISAPLVLGGAQTWSVDGTGANGSSLTISGAITGGSTLAINNSGGSGIISLSAAALANTYSGTTTISNGGILQGTVAANLSANSAMVVDGTGILRLNGISNAVPSLAGSGTVQNNHASTAVTLTVGAANTSTTLSGVLQNGGVGTLALTKVGTGELELSGASTLTGVITVSAGRLKVTGTVNPGATFGSTSVGSAASTSGALYVPTGGTLNSATFNVGGNATGVGSLVINGGTVTATTAATNAGITTGNAGYGGFLLSAGSFTTPRFDTGTSVVSTAISVSQVSGGTFTTTGDYILLRNGRVDFTITGGSVIRNAPTNTISVGSEGASAYGATFTVAGGSIDNTGRTVRFSRSGTMSGLASVNLNAGTLLTGGIDSGDIVGPTNVLNFNGGTLKAAAASATFLSATGTAYTAYSNAAFGSFTGGAVIDSNGFNITLARGISAPTGSGVTSLTLGSAGSGYIGAPFVEFSGGTGSGATGYATVDLDPASASFGQVTGVVLTNPGNYTVAPTTVTLVGGGGTSATASIGGSAANVSGGLTKSGTGTLTLGAVNTYTGLTLINAGTLALGINSAIDSGGNVTVNGGILDLLTFTNTVGTVTLQSGTLQGSTGTLTSASSFALQSGTVDFTGAGGLAGPGVTKSTASTVTLTNNGLGTPFVNNVAVNAGTLAFSTSAQLGDSTNANNTLSFNGGTLSYTGAGSVALGANRVATLNASGGTLNVTQSTGALTLTGGIASASTGSLTKTGPGTVIIPGATAWTAVIPAVTVSEGTLQAGFGTGGISALTVASTGYMNLTNSAAEVLTLGTGLNALTLTGGAHLTFELGAPTTGDRIIVGTGGNALTSGGIITLDFINLGSLGAGTYDLLSDVSGSGLLTGGTTYVLGNAPSGYNYTINQTSSLVSLSVVNFNPIYWRNGQADSSWSTLGSGVANWTTDAAGTTDATAVPGTSDTVIFSTTSAPLSSTTITTTLDNNFTIDGLQFKATPTGVTAVTLNQGSAGTLTIAPSSTSSGISVDANGGNNVINAPLVASNANVASQTWSVDGTGANGSSLTVAGPLTINALIMKTGGGALSLSGGNSGAGGLTLSAGTLNINSNAALGTGTFTIAPGATINNSLGSSVNLSGTNPAMNWNGSFTFTGSNALNLGTGAVILGGNATLTASASTLTVGGAISDASSTRSLTKDGAGTLVIGGNVTIGGNLAVTLGTGTFSGATNTIGGSVTASGTAFTMSGDSTIGAGLSVTAGTAIMNGANTITGSVAVTGGTLTLGGANTVSAGVSVTTGTLNLNGVNTIASGVTLNSGNLNIGHAQALGVNAFTIIGGTIDNTSGTTLTLSTNNVQSWNGSFTFTGTNSLNMGNGAVTMTASPTLTLTASTLTLGGVIDDGASTFGLTKTGAGTLTLGAANTYGGTTVINQGTVNLNATQTLSASTNGLTFGTAAGNTNVVTLTLAAGVNATFGGTFLVQTDSASANTINIPTGQTMRLNGAVTVGYNSAANSTTKLTATGGGTLTIGAAGQPTNSNVQIGNGQTGTISNAATVDLTGLSTFYANLGTGTFRVGDPTTSGNTAGAGSTLLLAPNSTIVATTITSDSTSGSVTQLISLGSGANEFNATTITIGGSANRGTGTLNFNGASGTLKIRNLAGTGRAAMSVQDGSAGTASSLSGTVDLSGHGADLLLSTLTIGGRSAAITANGTGTFTYDTASGGGLDATTISVASRTGTTSTSGNVTGTLNIGANATITTLTMGTNSVALTSGSSTGDATANVTISGGTNTIGTVTMGVNTVAAAFATGSDTIATLAISGGTTTVSTAFSMGAQNSLNNAATTVNTATSTLNISAGSLILSGTVNLTMGSTTLDLNNVATATINLTGTGLLKVGGNITSAIFTGSSVTNTLNLDGGTLDMDGGNLGATATPVVFNANSGTLMNAALINTTAGLTKTTTGTLILSGTTNGWTGDTVFAVGGGTIRLGSGTAIPNGTGKGNLVTTNGVVDLNGYSETINGLSGTGTVDNLAASTASTLTVGDANTASTFSGTLQNTGTGSSLTLSKIGSGALTLATANTYTGGTNLTAGSILANNASALGTGTITVSSTGIRLVVGNGLTIANAVIIGANSGAAGRGIIEADSVVGTSTLSGAVTINNNAAAGGHFAAPTAGTVLVLSGVITSSVPVVQRLGTVRYSGGGTGYTAFTNSAETTQIGANNGLATTATVTIGANAAGNLDLNGFNQTLVGIVKGGFAATIGNSSTTANSVLTITGTSSWAGVIQDVIGSGTMKTGLTVAGTVTLTAANTYTGATTVTAGTLALGAANRLADTSALTVTGGTFDLGTFAETVAAVSITGGTIANGTLTGASYDLQAGTVSAILAGSSITATKTTAGTVTLSGANTYTGLTTISAGTLALGAAHRLADTSALTVTGGTFDLGTFAETVAAVSITGGTIANGMLTGASYDLQAGTVSAILAGSSITATKTTAGTIILSGANTYTGLTTISNGTLQVGSGTTGSLGSGAVTNNATLSFGRTNSSTVANAISGSGVLIQDGVGGTTILTGTNSYGTTTITNGTLQIGSGTTGTLGSGAVTNNATLSFGRTNSTTVSNDISGSGSLVQDGVGGTTILTGTNSYGTTTITNGTLQVGSGGTTGSLGSGAVSNNGILVINRSNAYGVSNAISGAGSLTQSGAGDLTLSGDNSFSGGTTVSAGTVRAGHANAFGSLATDLLALNAGTLTSDGATARAFANNVTVGGNITLGATTTNTGVLTFNGTVGLGSAVRTLTVDSNVTFAGIMSAGGLTKAGAGTLTLSGNNVFTLGTTISAGTLILNHVSALGTGAVTVNGGTLDLNTTNIAQVTNVITVTSGSVIGGTTTASVNTAGSPPAVTAVLTGAGGLTKTDAGTLTITTANFHTGATVANVAGAVIRASHLADTGSSLGASALTDVTKLQLGAGAVLEFTGATTTTSTRSFTLTDSAGITTAAGAGGLTFTLDAKIALSGATPALALVANNSGTNIFRAGLTTDDITAGRGLSVLTIDGTGTWVIGGNSNRFKGDIRIEVNGGTSGLESGALPSGAGTGVVIALANNARVRYEAGNTDDLSGKLSLVAGVTGKLDLGSNNVTFNSALAITSGTGSTATLSKEGSGKLTIAAGNNSNLNVTVTAGTLVVNSSLGDVTLASGSTLGGEGFVGAVSAASGSTIGPGNSPGTLTASTLAMFGGSTFEWQVQNAGTAAGTGYDTLTVTGALDLSNANSNNRIFLNISSLAGNGNGTALGNPLNFGPPAGVSSIRTFTFATVGSLNLGSNTNINDAFTITVGDFHYTDGSSSNAGLWSLSFADNIVTLTAVPEPSTYGFGLGALALAAAAIRRRKRQAKA